MRSSIRMVVTGAVLVGVVGVFSCKLPTPSLSRVVGGDSGAPTSEENDQGNVGGRVDTCIKGWVGYDDCWNFVLSEKNPKGKKDGVLWKLDKVPTMDIKWKKKYEVCGHYYVGVRMVELCGKRGVYFSIHTFEEVGK